MSTLSQTLREKAEFWRKDSSAHALAVYVALSEVADAIADPVSHGSVVQKFPDFHFAALAELAGGNASGFWIWRNLRLIETRVNRFMVRCCNEEVSDKRRDRHARHTREAVAAEFGGKLPDGFFINGDPRGYSLKIESAKKLRLQTDMGGDYILAPSIRGLR